MPWITDSVLPIVAAKRVDVVKSDHMLNDMVKLVPTPGHTIDHYSVHVGKSGQDAFLTGDMIHSPLQGRYPDLGMRADYDSKQAGRDAPQDFRHALRYADADLHGAFPVAVHGQARALGRRVQARPGLSRRWSVTSILPCPADAGGPFMPRWPHTHHTQGEASCSPFSPT